jgi:hypothetical protein
VREFEVYNGESEGHRRERVCVCVREREKERDREEEREVVRHTHIQRARKSKGGVNSSKGNRAS